MATLERQTRTRPSATPPVISVGSCSKCAICLDQFIHYDKFWRLQCGHRFHAQCWDRVARAHVDRQLAGTVEGAATEAPCAICRGVGLIAAGLHSLPRLCLEGFLLYK
eukprot:4740580-Pyramimonas_sp.AAC.1